MLGTPTQEVHALPLELKPVPKWVWQHLVRLLVKLCAQVDLSCMLSIRNLACTASDWTMQCKSLLHSWDAVAQHEPLPLRRWRPGGRTPAADARRHSTSHSSAVAEVRLEGPRRSARPEKGPYMVTPLSWACAQDAQAGCEKVTKAKPREWLVILSRMTCARAGHAVRGNGHRPAAPWMSTQARQRRMTGADILQSTLRKSS